MSVRFNTELLTELKEFGEVDIEKCFNCGNCTAICPLTNDEHPFPRNNIRMIQMGMREQLLASVDPWMCYYCGDCTKTCPRGAEPAEAMMATRRWLISEYDQTGHAKGLYTSEKKVVQAIIRTSLLPLSLLLVYHLITKGVHIHTDQVVLNDFAPVFWVWIIALLHFAYLGYILLRNSIVMVRNVIGPDKNPLNIPVGAYLAGIREFIIQIFSQRRWWSECDETRKVEFNRWKKHIILMSGYGLMLILIVPLLMWFQTDNLYPIYNPQRWLGYYATIVLIFTSIEIIISRVRKDEEMHRFSQPTDWLFPGFLLFGAISGILVHILRYMGLPWPTYIAYTVHVMAMIAMLDTEVGIGKWTHLIYRPLALSLDAVMSYSREQETVSSALASAD